MGNSNSGQINWNFLVGANVLSNGNILNINAGMVNMNIEVTNANGNTIIFEGQCVYNGIWSPIMCVRLSDLSLATSTTGNGEIWSADLTGLISFRTRISNYISGIVTVNGRVVN